MPPVVQWSACAACPETPGAVPSEGPHPLHSTQRRGWLSAANNAVHQLALSRITACKEQDCGDLGGHFYVLHGCHIVEREPRQTC